MLRSRKIHDFIRNAALCRKMAESARAPHRATFLELAQHWTAMAELEARIAEMTTGLEKDFVKTLPLRARHRRAA